MKTHSSRCRQSHFVLAHAAQRNRAISRRISWNISRGYSTSIAPSAKYSEAAVTLTADDAFSAEQCHARLWPNNATRLSGKEWLCCATRA